MKSAQHDLSTSRLLRIFLPLSLTDMIMILSGPLIAAVLGRLPDVQVHLAAYGAALSLALLLESPIIMMLHAANAASANPVAYRRLRTLMWLYNGAITLLFAAVAFTPLFDLVAEGWLALPSAVAAAARPAFAWMLLWPAAIGVRRYMQGLLIRHRRSREVMYAGLVRLAGLVAALLLAAAVGLPGATVAGVGLTASVLAEALAIGVFAYRLRSELRSAVPATAGAEIPVSLGGLFWWYLPLASTQVLVWITRPAVTAGIARADLAELSLAAWPVAWSTVNILGNGVRMVQQLTISLVHDAESGRRIRNFSLQMGLAYTILLTVIAVTSLGDRYLIGVVGLPAHLAEIAHPVLLVGALFPIGVAVQNWLQGLVIKTGQTVRINAAALVGGVVTVGLVFAGGRRLGLSGASLAAVATMLGLAVELALLWLFSAPARMEYSAPSDR